MLKRFMALGALLLIGLFGLLPAALASDTPGTVETDVFAGATFTSADSFVLAHNPLPLPQMLLVQAGTSAAVTPASDTPETPGFFTRWMQRQEELGPWWRRSPFEYDPMPQDWLWRVSLQYNYVYTTGNMCLNNRNVDFQLTTRKGRFTNYLKYVYDRRDARRPADEDWLYNAQGEKMRAGVWAETHAEKYLEALMRGERYDGFIPDVFRIEENETTLRISTRHHISNELRYAVTPNFFLITPGFEWEKDDYSSIENRFTFFAGPGYRFYPRENIILTAFGAFAYEMDKPMEDEFLEFLAEMELLEFDDGWDNYSAYYLGQEFFWQITEILSFMQYFNYLAKFDDSTSYRWDLGLGLNVQVARYVSLNLNYEENYNNQPNYFVRPRDTSSTVGVQIAF